MTEKSTLWNTLESNPAYSKYLMRAFELYEKRKTPETHDGVSMLEHAVGHCTDVKIIQYMAENKFWHCKGEPFDFAIAATAILNPNEKILEYLITQGLCLEEDKEHGCGPLHIACADNSNPKVIKTIINAGADINLRETETGVTPFLMAASKNNNPEILKVLKKAGADIFAKTNDGKSALHIAAKENNNAEILETLISFGLDVNEEDNAGCTPFMYGVTRPNAEIFKTLIKHGAHLIVKDKLGQSPLFYAAYLNTNPLVVRTMLRIGYPVNEKNIEGRTPLMYSSLNVNDEIAGILIDNGADVNEVDATGKKAYCYVLEQTQSTKIVKKMAALSNFANDEHVRWLFLAAVAGYNNLPMLKYVLKLGADINTKNSDNRSVLHFAASSSVNPKVLQFLVKSGLDVNALDDIKATPFLYAARGNQSPEALMTLLQLGADPHITHNDKRSALHIACEQNPSLATVEFLVKSGLFNINEKDSLGFSPFLYSTANPNLDVMKMLVKNGADTKATDSEGCNALCVAGSNAHSPEFIDYLVDELKLPIRSKGKNGYDSIYYCAFNNCSVEVLDRLVVHGAELYRFYQNGMNLLMIASRFNMNPEIVRYLVKTARINVNLRSREPEGEDEIAPDEVKAEVIKQLEAEAEAEELKNKKYVPYRDTYKKGTTAIMHAACNINIEILETLIGLGANIHDHDKAGRDLLNYAAGSNENPIIPKILISKYGFRTNRRDENEATAVFDAAMNPNVETMQSILEYGGDLYIQAAGGVTPLMIASIVNPNPEMIKFLLEQGLSVHDSDDSGMTPLLHAAASNENPEVCEVLIAAGASIYDENAQGSNAVTLARSNPNPAIYHTIMKYASMNVAPKEDHEDVVVN